MRIDEGWSYLGLRAVILKTRHLRVTVLLEIGGRVWILAPCCGWRITNVLVAEPAMCHPIHLEHAIERGSHQFCSLPRCLNFSGSTYGKEPWMNFDGYPKWPLYSLLTMLFWGLWGFEAKWKVDRASPYAVQLLLPGVFRRPSHCCRVAGSKVPGRADFGSRY